MLPKKLNLGCGVDIKEGWINLDSARLPGVDVVHDIETLPLPFRDEEFDEILAHDVLEHVEYIPVLKDLCRILKKGGTLTIRVPHFTSKNNFIDPTHKKQFSVNTFDFFVKHPLTKNAHLEKERVYYFDFVYDKVKKRRITFEKSSRIFFYNRIVEWIFNLSPRMQSFYESTGFSREFPAENIITTLIK
jgi:predicted SAM-dependent methyltransferase